MYTTLAALSVRGHCFARALRVKILDAYCLFVIRAVLVSQEGRSDITRIDSYLNLVKQYNTVAFICDTDLILSCVILDKSPLSAVYM